MPEYQQQVDKEHYSFSKYYYPGRWMSYWHETNEILFRPDIASVLDIGPGCDLLRNVLKTFAPQLEYKTLDVAADVRPDHVGSVTNIPLEENSFDAACAFQVLEHIEFSDFEIALQELKRVSRKYVIISLPHFGPQLTFQLKLPLLPKIELAAKIPFPKKLEFQGQHYWEIGRKGYPAAKIRNTLLKHFVIEKEFVPFENQYHRFFILKKQ